MFEESKLPKDLPSKVQEDAMNNLAPTVDGEPDLTVPGRFARLSTLFNLPLEVPKTMRKPSSSVFGKYTPPLQLPEEDEMPGVHHPVIGRSHTVKASPRVERNTMGRFNRFSFIADSRRDSSEACRAETLPRPRARPLSNVFESFTILRAPTPFGTIAEQTELAVEAPTGIFGVPLRQSITYANVAISLVDAEGKSYIYGYVPIVVAKCGVYLKEKGE